MLGLYLVERGLITQTWREFLVFFWGKSANSSTEIANKPPKKILAHGK